MREFGWTNPILVDGDSGIIAGHGRLQAARKLGMAQVPVIELAGLSEAQKKALILADNKLALNAGWDKDLLKIEFGDLKLAGFDLSITGFSADEVAVFTADKTAGLTDPDETPEPPALPVSEPGDVWVLGNHRIVCGDSTDILVVERALDGERASLVFTDPPYGVEYQSNQRTKSRKFDVLKNDDTFLDIAPIIEACSDGWVFVWTSWKVQSKWLDNLSGFGYPTNMVIWYKPGGGIGDLKKTFSTDYEVALVWNRGAELCGKRIGSVWTVNKDAAVKYLHPTQKPVELASEAMDKTTIPGALVLDLFGGSGSTLIACEKMGRRGAIVELDPRYVDVAVTRWQSFTGKTAILEATGETFAQMLGKRRPDAAITSKVA